jgi:hypothetical protein
VTLGLLAALLGLTLSFLALRGAGRKEAAEEFDLRTLVSVIGGLLSRAFFLPRLGLIPATLALVTIASLASRPVRPVTLLLVAVAMSTFSALLFIRLMGMPMRPIIW